MADESGQITRLTLRDALTVAIRLHQHGHFDEAEASYLNILKSVPDQPDALHYLGVLCHQIGRSDEAVSLIRRALAQEPDHADAHNNLGNILREQKMADEAEAAYRRAIELAPDHADALYNLGMSLKARGEMEEALTRFEAAIEAAPGHSGAHHKLITTLNRLGRQEEALKAARRAVEQGADRSEGYMNLSDVLRGAGRIDEAVEVVRQWLKFEPDHPIARHQLASYLGEDVPDRASDRYVSMTFDGFASTFDEVLRGLEYRAPGLIAEGLSDEMKASVGRLDILDAGCGTGLCGELLRKHARRLIGVDLSSGMIAQARERQCYDQLITADLTAFLKDTGERFDLVASADTLVYIGDLAPFFAAVYDRLRPGGELIFTVEHAADLEKSAEFRLDVTGRYCHSRAYLEKTLAGAGLLTRSIRQETLRKQLGKPVAGLLVAAGRQ